MGTIRQAFGFFIKAIGVGVAALLIAAGISNLMSDWKEAQLRVQEGKRDAADASMQPFEAVNAGPIRFMPTDDGGGADAATAAWVVNRKTGSVRLCVSAVNRNGIVEGTDCGTDNKGD